MLERMIVRNFKRFDEIEIELGDAVVFIGPNNAGKTTALQALALWDLGVRRWSEKRRGNTPERRPGVAINRRDLLAVPVPHSQLLWKDLRIRESGRQEGNRNVRIEILVHGIDAGKQWSCGLEFDYANTESIYCRPLREDEKGKSRMEVPAYASDVRVAYLPPMSGLAPTEVRLDPGAVEVRLGEGRTAEVLRNLCLQVSEQGSDEWGALIERIKRLFGVTLSRPEYVRERGEVVMSYTDMSGLALDLSAAGRGLQQTLLLLSYMQLHPGAVVLLDEPDAHLEILRQRQIYTIITDLARRQRCQVVAASHSEVLLNEAADRDIVVAFVGRPHRIDDRGSQVVKSLKAIGFEAYYQAEQQGWVLYLEGSTDLAILKAFAKVLEHPAANVLSRPFVQYVENQPQKARDHFYGLREAKEDLVGFLLLDRVEARLHPKGPLRERMWKRREVENYLCFPEVLEAYAMSLAHEGDGPLFVAAEQQRLVDTMRRVVEDHVPPVALRDRESSWWKTTKASDDFLDPVFQEFFRSLEIPNLMRKTDYHQLASLIPRESVPLEVTDVLDDLVELARLARPVGQSEST